MKNLFSSMTAGRGVSTWLALVLLASCLAAAEKTTSVLYPAALRESLAANVQRAPWAARIQAQIIAQARPWMELSEEQLWDLMFGASIDRSWMVWSDGHCPACKEPVPMYEWKMAALERPWKTWCPHCQEMFPKNDFAAFYRSGLGEHGVFDPQRADRSLLFNQKHPDRADPLHRFGVDDGNGYVDGDKRWRFIGAYLVYGQWKQAVLGGIKALAQAYVATGDPRYARRAGILLDRVADLYPTFDFHAQALLYERVRGHGYVSVWHDACEETRELALAYDQVFDGVRDDPELVSFLSRQAERWKLDNPKRSFQDIQRNIEQRILNDAMTNRAKITSNYPRTDIMVAHIKAVLNWPENRDEVYGLIDQMLQRATAVNGVTGEKGLANYSAFGLQGLAVFLAEWDRAEPGFLQRCLDVHPQLRQTYRFHIDTWCLQRYYPLSGDTGNFARPIEQYPAVRFQRLVSGADDAPLVPSMYSFLWKLHRLTGDVAFVQVLYHANGESVDGLPHDLFATDAAALQAAVASVIAEHGPVPQVGSVNKQQWRIGILRSGEGRRARAAWLDYDSGGGHGHWDGMNLGLFARGLDLMPDFGYPPVQYGGWESPRAVWYRQSAAHNTVVVDGRNQWTDAGAATLWADGRQFRALRASAPKMIRGLQYERTVASIDIDDADSYLLDVFRVVGGRDHAKYVHSHFGELAAESLTFLPCEPLGHSETMRDFRTAGSAAPGWNAVWHIEDRYNLLPSETLPGQLRYIDLTTDAEVYRAEGWVATGSYGSTTEAWIPRLMVRRQSEQTPLASTFVAIIQPHAAETEPVQARRLGLKTPDGQEFGDAHVAVEVRLPDGRSDLLIAADVENPLGIPPLANGTQTLIQADWQVEFAGELCLVRRRADGQPLRVAVCRAHSLKINGTPVEIDPTRKFQEVELQAQ